jgi:uncharacterized lipoprotein YddW (UPF0748 family)
MTLVADSLRLPSIPREFRGVWVATVNNIDWPSAPGLPVELQQAELITILDRAQALRLNAIIFQVRPAGDALYASTIEPWSEYLTGRQGVAPSPAWDPLEFAVREAHARGLELHAWFNPYRAKDASAKGPLAAQHFGTRNPTLVKRYGKMLWMDPGEPAVRRHTVRVILDVVRRYDVDGVHIDDYFYPYPVAGSNGRNLPFPDDASYRKYTKAGGTLARDAWRRDNVDRLVDTLSTAIHAVKPWVKFGISPFGIWRPGEPAGIEGFDAYESIYADARRWLREGWVDYFSPQLYWPTTAPAQGYATLLQWWGEQNTHERHLWPGNYTSRVGTRGDWPTTELVTQVLATRADRTATGNVHFSMSALMKNQSGVADALVKEVYDGPALVPASPWLPGAPPRAPAARVVAQDNARFIACLGNAALVPPRWWVLRVQRDGIWSMNIIPGTTRQLALGRLAPTDSVALSAVDRTGREGGVSVASAAQAC